MSTAKRGRKPKSVSELLQGAPKPPTPTIQKQRLNKESLLKSGEFIAIDTDNGREFITNELMFKNLNLGNKKRYVRKSEKPKEIEN